MAKTCCISYKILIYIMKSCIIYFCIPVVFSFNFGYGQSGSLDSTFGNNGIVITDFNTDSEYFTSLELQPDQKIIAIGWAYGFGRFIACRYNTDGSLDSSFGDNGQFTVFPPEIVVCDASALQNDGKIVIGGTKPIFIVPTKSDEEDLILLRLNQEGKIDSSFGVDGILITDLGGHFERIGEVIIQGDSKILVSGQGADNIQGGFYYMVRYDTNGQLDPTFGDQGIKKIYEEFTVQTMVLQPDGKILIGGYGDLGLTANFDVRRFNSDGSIDDSFGDVGRVNTDVSGQRDYVFSINVEPDDKIFVSGAANVSGGTSDLAFARYYSNGSLDGSYGSQGFEIISLSPYSVVTDMARQPDGKYVLCGSSNHLDGEFHVLLIRIKHDGGLDESFGDQGIVYTTSLESYHGARELVVQNNNYVVLGGVSAESGSGSDFALSRYIVDDIVATKDQYIKPLLMMAYPNPSKDFISVAVGKPFEKFHCTIFDLMGRLLLDRTVRADLDGRVTIHSESITSGYYSVLLENNVMRGVVNIIVQK
jgi:uncharacterized delta-60 repeat protein